MSDRHTLQTDIATVAIPENSVSAEEPKAFRIANQRLLLTYRSHIPKDDLEQFIGAWKPMKRYIISHENGDSSVPYEHTHMAVEFTKVVQSRNARILDFNGIHPNIKPLISAKAFLDAVTYCEKEDKEPKKIGDFNRDSMVKQIQECDTICDALERFSMGDQHPLQYASQVAMVYGLKQRKIEQKQIVLRPWQEQIMDILNEPPIDRMIYWFRDWKGAAGKTTFGRWLRNLFGNKAAYLKQTGPIKDCATIIEGALKQGWTGEVCILDLPRDCMKKQIYEPLESIIDGAVTSTKYQGGTHEWTPGYVFIFCNFLPDIHRMTLDRWQVYDIEPGGGRGTLLTLKEVESLRMEELQVIAGRAERDLFWE